MIHKIDTQPSFARAWLAAASYLHEELKPHRDAYNLILEIEDAGEYSDVDRRICSVVDGFVNARVKSYHCGEAKVYHSALFGVWRIWHD